MDLAVVSILVLCGVCLIAYAGLRRRDSGTTDSASTDANHDNAADSGSDGGGGGGD